MTELDVAVLNLEAQHWRHQGTKEAAITARTGLSAVRYYQVLNRLIDTPAALAHSPLVVNRLRRLREQGVRRRWS